MMVPRKRLSRILQKHAARLTTETEVTPLFWTKLMEHNVISFTTRVPIESGDNDHERVYRLLQHIDRDPVGRFKGLVYALDETEQTALSEMLWEALDKAEQRYPEEEEEEEQVSGKERIGNTDPGAAASPPQQNSRRQNLTHNQMEVYRRMSEREIEALLVETSPELLRRMNIDPTMMTVLEREKVVIDTDIDYIMGPSEAYKRKTRLLEHIRCDPVRRFPGLVRALAETEQDRILTDVFNQHPH